MGFPKSEELENPKVEPRKCIDRARHGSMRRRKEKKKKGKWKKSYSMSGLFYPISSIGARDNNHYKAKKKKKKFETQLHRTD